MQAVVNYLFFFTAFKSHNSILQLSYTKSVTTKIEYVKQLIFLIYSIIDALHFVLLYIISMGIIDKEGNLRQTDDNLCCSGLSSMLSGQPSEYRDLIAQEVACSCAA